MLRSFILIAAVCCALALVFALHARDDRQDPLVAPAPSVTQAPAVADSPAPGVVAFAAPTTPPPDLGALDTRATARVAAGAPLPADPVRVPLERAPSAEDPTAREALQEFSRDVAARLENCAGVVGGLRSLVPVQVIFRRASHPDEERQTFVAVSAHPLPLNSASGPLVVAPQSERCLPSALAGLPVFLPRSSATAAEFAETLTLYLPSVAAHL